MYVQMRCWAERGVLAAVFERLRDRGLVASDTEIAVLDSTSVKVHLLALDDRRAWSFSLSAGASARCSGGLPAAPAERPEAPEVSDYGPCL